MASTNTKIKIGLVQDGVKFYITLIPKFDIKPFSKLYELKQDNVTFRDYATLEKNTFILNDKKPIFTMEDFEGETDIEGIGICSEEISNENCEFLSPLVLEIELMEPIKNKGISLTFGRYSYITNMDIGFYLDDELKFSNNYSPNAFEYNFDGGNEEYTYNKIILTFYKTNLPYRYLKIVRLDFGQIISFNENQVYNANVLEEIDLLSNEVSVNTADFELYSENDDFNMFNPSGIYEKLKLNQPVEIYHTEDGIDRFMGKFYLTDWESESENFGKFKAQDLIGYLKTIDYNVPFNTYDKENYLLYTEIISKMCENSSIDYDDFFDIETNNLSKFCSVIGLGKFKEIIQSLSFASGKIIDCSRKRKIIVKDLEKSEDTPLIDKTRIFSNTLKVKKINNPNSINIYGYDYENGSSDETENTLYSASITEGRTHLVTFDSPKKFLGFIENEDMGYPNYDYKLADGIYIVDYSPFHVRFYIDETVYPDESFPIEVKILGNDMKDYNSLTNYNYKQDDEVENAVQIDCNLVHIDNDKDYVHTKEVIENIIEYYKNTYEVECEIELGDEQVGDNVRVEVFHNQEIGGHITSLDINLTGGYTAKMKLLGKVVE